MNSGAGMSTGRGMVTHRKFDGLSQSSKQVINNEDSTVSIDEIDQKTHKKSFVIDGKGKKSILSKRSGAHAINTMSNQNNKNSTIGGGSSRDKLSQRGIQNSSRVPPSSATVVQNFYYARSSIKNSPRNVGVNSRLRNADLHNLNTEEESLK